MLVTLATLLARSKRLGKPLVAAQVRHFDIAAAVARAAEVQKSPIIFTVDTRRGVYHEPSQLLAGVLEIARSLPVDVAVEVLADANHDHIDHLLEVGAPSITAIGHNLSKGEQEKLYEWVHNRTRAYGSEVILHTDHHGTFEDVEKMVEKTGAAIVRSNHAQELSHSKVVTIDDRSDLTLNSLKKLTVHAHTLNDLLESAFTAGLRTALRNREAVVSSDYLPTAFLAVEKAIIPYLS